MTATQQARKPFELMDLAESLLMQSREQLREATAEVIPPHGILRVAPLGYTRAAILADQASALIALAQARMLGQGRA